MQTQDIPYGYCQCGCGDKAALAPKTVKSRDIRRGDPLKFAPGHSRRRTSEVLARRVGQIFGRWTLIEPARDRNDKIGYLCRCECGTERFVAWVTLRHHKSRSCGCLKAERAGWPKGKPRPYARRHGAYRHPLYFTWSGMMQRCNNPNSPNYAHYGGRGISVCERWQRDPYAFFADMGERPDGCSLERVDNDGPYSPDNCCWANAIDQARNRRHPRIEPGSPRRQRRETAFREVLAFLMAEGWPATTSKGDDALALEYAALPPRRQQRHRAT